MENFSNLMTGFSVALTTYHIAIMVAGVLLGILVGVLPGLGAPNGVSLLLPLTFTMDPVSAIILLDQHVLGRAVRRLDHIDPVQHSGRAVLRRHDLRRLSAWRKKGQATQALTLAFLSAGHRRAVRRAW